MAGAFLPPGVEPLPADALAASDIGVTVQAYSPVLDGIQTAPDGILSKNGATIAGRTITGSSAEQIIVTNGSGAAGDPVIGTPQDIDATATPTFGGIITTGGVYRSTVTLGTGSHFVLDAWHIIYADASGGDVDLELPPASAGPRELVVDLIDASAGSATFTPDGADTINGMSGFVMSTIYTSLTLRSDGTTAWRVFALVRSNAIKTVSSKADLPPAVAGAIPIAKPYFVDGLTDLTGDYLDIQPGGALEGMNPQVDGFLSTGLGPGAIVRSTATVTMRRIAFIGQGASAGVDIDGISSPTNVISLREVFFVACTSLAIKDYSALLWKDSALVSCGPMTLDGGFLVAGLQNMIFDPVPDGVTAMVVPATATFGRRLDLDLVAMVLAGAGSVGINCAVAASIPSEGYVLRDCSIEGGGGTPLVGKLASDPSSLFENNMGFPNTSVVGGLSMEDNATTTVIAVAGTYVLVTGTTTASANLERFTHNGSGRLTHIGQIERLFLVIVSIATTDAANDDIAVKIAVNGTIDSPRAKVSHNTAGDIDPFTVAWHVLLGENDYIEPFIANLSDTSNIIAEELTMTANPA